LILAPPQEELGDPSQNPQKLMVRKRKRAQTTQWGAWGRLTGWIITTHEQLNCVVPDWAVFVSGSRTAEFKIQLKGVMCVEGD